MVLAVAHEVERMEVEESVVHGALYRSMGPFLEHARDVERLSQAVHVVILEQALTGIEEILRLIEVIELELSELCDELLLDSELCELSELAEEAED